MDEKAAFKQRLIESCLSLLQNKKNLALEQLRELQESANSETKSSMGDKYETSRAMVMLEKEKAASQLEVIEKHIQALRQIKPVITSEIKSGSVINLSDQSYFIAASLGKMQFESQDIFVISAVSPIGKALLGKKQGDTLSFQNRDLTIEEVF